MRVGPRVAVTAHEGAVYVARLPDGPIHVLEGTAALIWSQALALPRAGVAGAVADVVEGDPAEVAAEVDVFVAALVEQGLLTESGEA